MSPRATVVCAICGKESIQPLTASAPAPAPAADFDTRPAEPLRSTILDWIQACPDCGYCADDISRAAAGVADIVQSAAYRSYLEDTSLPAPATGFLRYSCLLERLHQHADAGWSALHAAWACDDAGEDNSAVRCRERTIALWRKAKAAGQQFADDLASEFALVTDVYRRMGEFGHAIVACSEGLDLEDVQPMLERRDSSAHSIAELTVSGRFPRQ
jgi:hypothetical protein